MKLHESAWYPEKAVEMRCYRREKPEADEEYGPGLEPVEGRRTLVLAEAGRAPRFPGNVVVCPARSIGVAIALRFVYSRPGSGLVLGGGGAGF